MRERSRKFALSLHPEKTRLIEFGRFAAERRQRRGFGRPETFNFLGFTSSAARPAREIPDQTEDPTGPHASEAQDDQRGDVAAHAPADPRAGGGWGGVVHGYLSYHAVPTNAHALHVFRHHVTDLWRRTLRQRSQRIG